MIEEKSNDLELQIRKSEDRNHQLMDELKKFKELAQQLELNNIDLLEQYNVLKAHYINSQEKYQFLEKNFMKQIDSQQAENLNQEMEKLVVQKFE